MSDYIETLITIFLVQLWYMVIGAMVIDTVLGWNTPTIEYNRDKPRHPSRIIVTGLMNFIIRYLFLQFWILFPLFALIKWYLNKLSEYRESRGL